MGGKGKSAPAAPTTNNTYVHAAPTQPIDRTETNPQALERASAAPNMALLSPDEQEKKYQSSMLG